MENANSCVVLQKYSQVLELGIKGCNPLRNEGKFRKCYVCLPSIPTPKCIFDFFRSCACWAHALKDAIIEMKIVRFYRRTEK